MSTFYANNSPRLTFNSTLTHIGGIFGVVDGGRGGSFRGSGRGLGRRLLLGVRIFQGGIAGAPPHAPSARPW